MQVVKLNLMVGARNMHVPSHILYADGVMIFCRGTQNTLRNVMSLFSRYGEISGQKVNSSKSKFYVDSHVSSRRQGILRNILDFGLGSMPFFYLGIPIFKGKPRRLHLMPFADRIRLKVASWKAALLTITGRIQLVRSIISSMLIYSFMVYAWPVCLIKLVDQWVRNFIWSGCVDKRKVATMAWHKVCKPLEQGGFGIRSS